MHINKMFLPPFRPFSVVLLLILGSSCSRERGKLVCQAVFFADLCGMLLMLERLGNACFLFPVSDNLNMIESGGSMLLT